jgi:AraC family transcriptional activator of pobA
MVLTKKYGNLEIIIEAGSYCIFDISYPSNSIHHHSIMYEICFVTAGSGEFLHGEEIYQIKKGDVFIANPDVYHEIRLLEVQKSEYTDKLHLIFFSFKISSENNPPISFEDQLLYQFLKKHNIISKSQLHLFAYLSFLRDYSIQSHVNNYWLYQIAEKFCLECIFSLLDIKNPVFKEIGVSRKIIDKAIEYISVNINRRIYIDEIATSINYSKRNIQLVFKKHMNKTITEYINERKIALAVGYLKMNFKVGEVSNILGIDDSAQFSRLFKKYYGISPKKFQASYTEYDFVSGSIRNALEINSDY